MLRLAEGRRLRRGGASSAASKRRPDFRALRPDLGDGQALAAHPPALARTATTACSRGVAGHFRGAGHRARQPARRRARRLRMPEGLLTGSVSADDNGARSARPSKLRVAIGRLDIGQGAVAVQGRVVAVEDAAGTQALLERVAALRGRRPDRKVGRRPGQVHEAAAGSAARPADDRAGDGGGRRSAPALTASPPRRGARCLPAARRRSTRSGAPGFSCSASPCRICPRAWLTAAAHRFRRRRGIRRPARRRADRGDPPATAGR